MKLSTRPRYGMRALVDIATHSKDEPVRLKEIARRQNVSLSYLEHIVGPLISGGILRSTRGPGGGVSLLAKPEEISLERVVGLLEGPLGATDCVVQSDICSRAGQCATRSLWVEVSDAMREVLRGKTLADLMQTDTDTAGEGSCTPQSFRPLQEPVSLSPRTSSRDTQGGGS